nr:uncharacterized protein LOC114826319 [Malus domestica]
MEHTVQESDPGSRHEGKGKERAGSVPWKDLRVATRPKDFGDINNCLAGRRFAFDELGEPLAKDESDCDRMLKLSSYVMAEYHDRLQEVERYKAKLKENKQLVDEARRNKGLLTQALQLKDETMESLKRRKCSEDESDNEGSADAQTQHGEEGLGDAEDDGRTRSDTARGSTSDENE